MHRMTHIIFFALGLLLLAHPASAVTRDDIPRLLSELVRESFPELDSAYREGRITIRDFNSSDYFLKTSLRKGKLSSDSKLKKYSVDVNPEIYGPEGTPSGGPTLNAVRGILAHELVHLVDYETGGPQKIIGYGLYEIFSPTHYERVTDRRAFERGYAEGIREYRIWIYGKLSPKALRLKKIRYYRPEEIDAWIHENRP